MDKSRICDARALGVGTTVFVTLRTEEHSHEWAEGFSRVVDATPEIVEVYRMTGENDYLLRLAVTDLTDYDRVYKNLAHSICMKNVSSSFAMEQIKYSTALPVRERS